MSEVRIYSAKRRLRRSLSLKVCLYRQFISEIHRFQPVRGLLWHRPHMHLAKDYLNSRILQLVRFPWTYECFTKLLDRNYSVRLNLEEDTLDDGLSQISRRSGGVPRLPSVSSSRINVKTGRVQKIPQKKFPGYQALKEIRRQQASTDLLFAISPFTRVVKEIMQQMSSKQYRIQSGAIRALMEAAQAFVLTLFDSANLCTAHAKRVTLMTSDIQLVRRILHMWGMRDL